MTTRDTAALDAYLRDRIGMIEAVRAAEVTPILRRFKRAGTLMEGVRLAAPE